MWREVSVGGEVSVEGGECGEGGECECAYVSMGVLVYV